MISGTFQLFSWISSIFLGFIYGFISNKFIKFTRGLRLIYRLFLDIIYVIICSALLIFIYYKINGGYIHYSYLIFWSIGYYLFFLVKSCVKRHK